MSSTTIISKDKITKDAFRDSVSTVDRSGNRIWLYPKNPKGKFTNWRNIIAVLLITLLFSGPFMTIGGEPILLLNVVERKFFIFGKIFWPQDFHIFLLIMMAFMVFIGVFTMIYGRIFCGWICPQTIFMENVFRKIEYWIEGDWKTRMALDKAPLTANKIYKKTLKHFIFFIISLLIANTFLSYVLGIKEVFKIWNIDTFSESYGIISSLLIFTLIFYWVFTRLREQVCTTICPYGRLQGVLTDKNTLLVIYDFVRGERRAKIRKNENRKQALKGDCIDCNQCVNVCPMGIDIRNGTQLECTNCTACIDACDFMMESVGLPKGLIRFDSEAGIAEKKPFKMNGRIILYSIVLVLLSVFITTLLIFRADVETTFLRTPGMTYQTMENGKISNLYNLKIINKTSKEKEIYIRMLSEEGEIKLIGNNLTLPSQGTVETAAFIILDKKNIKSTKTEIKIGVFSQEKQLETIQTTFIGPAN